MTGAVQTPRASAAPPTVMQVSGWFGYKSRRFFGVDCLLRHPLNLSKPLATMAVGDTLGTFATLGDTQVQDS